MKSSLTRVPVTLRFAKAFIADHHRHHSPPRGWKFGVSVALDGVIVGIGIAGRPVARHLDDGKTLEVTRCCVLADEHVQTKNACSILYGALCRASFALGYEKVISYTMDGETGSSLAAAGFTKVARSSGGEWSRESRPRKEADQACKKDRWERAA